MNKRLLKRHKRQVSRANGRVRLSEPDLRSPEQIMAAREAGRAAGNQRTGPTIPYATGQTHHHVAAMPADDTAKAGG